MKPQQSENNTQWEQWKRFLKYINHLSPWNLWRKMDWQEEKELSGVVAGKLNKLIRQEIEKAEQAGYNKGRIRCLDQHGLMKDKPHVSQEDFYW